MSRIGRWRRGKEERCSFLKKRTKKLLFLQVSVLRVCRIAGEGEQAKAFWFFFSKKNILPRPLASIRPIV
jgi:hypothetical protein